jgi:Domain of unknown function (DUF4263)
MAQMLKIHSKRRPRDRHNSFRPAWGELHDADLRPIQTEWRQLLSRKRVKEQTLHAFLARHAQIAFADHFAFAAAISKLRLGADLVTDFVCVYDNWSNGIRYKLVEIEKPDTAPFTKEGICSSGLSRAIQQVLSWKDWLEEHVTEKRRLLPSFFYDYSARSVFEFEIIIGTRSNSERWLDRRLALAQSLGISIRSFDSITPRLGYSLKFDDYSNIGDETHNLNSEARSELACPFVSALTDPAWRTMVQEARHASFHFMGRYGRLLVKHRKENEYAGYFRRVLRRRAATEGKLHVPAK